MPVKIDRQIAEEIRALVRQGVTQKEIAYRVGLSKSTVSMIVANKVWRQEDA
jgi:DNA-binding NarL/FixJ family response regulator